MPGTSSTNPTAKAATEAVDHPSPAERVEAGKKARALVPRSSNAVFEVTPARPDPVGLLEEQATSRVPELVPIRYGRMLTSPFAFYRGAALVMASDLATTPHSNLTVQLCGDAHLSNFGVFGSAERSLMFDVNDFDETLRGPWEWDLKRLAASVVVAGRDRGLSEADQAAAAIEVARAYREEMRRLAGLGNLDVWYSRLDVDQLLTDLEGRAQSTGSKKDKRLAAKTKKGVAKARTHDSLQALSKLTHLVDGQRQIISDPPLIVPIDELMTDMRRDVLFEQLHEVVRRYRRSLQSDRRELLEQFELVDVARKVVGVGSVGTRAWILLLTGRDGDDPLFLQAKEAEGSVFERFVGRSPYRNHGERVVAGQHVMQASSDIFLGWDSVEGIDGKRRDFYFRQLRDWKGSFDMEHMKPTGLIKYANVCSLALARAHARSGDRIAIAAYLGSSTTFDHAIASFAGKYADQNERDFEALAQAAASGRIHAEAGL